MTINEGGATLRSLADRDAIRDLPIRYAHFVWTKDVASLAELFVDGGEMNTGTQLLRGRDEIRATYLRAFQEDDFYPFVHNHVIEIDGDEARGRCDLDLRAVTSGARMSGFGSYVDRYVRTADGWKFKSRALTMQELRPAAE